MAGIALLLLAIVLAVVLHKVRYSICVTVCEWWQTDFTNCSFHYYNKNVHKLHDRQLGQSLQPLESSLNQTFHSRSSSWPRPWTNPHSAERDLHWWPCPCRRGVPWLSTHPATLCWWGEIYSSFFLSYRLFNISLTICKWNCTCLSNHWLLTAAS